MNAGFAISFAFLFALVTVFVVLVVGAVLVIRAFLRRDEPRRLHEDEEMQLRRLMESLGRMEERIVNLETILLERGAQERNTRP